MSGSTDSREKRLAELKREVTQRGFDRHASALKHVSELPADLQSPALMALTVGKAIQGVVVFPPQIQRGWDYVPKQALVFTAEGVIHILASIWGNQDPKVTYLKSCDIMSMKVTLVLLYGLLEIVARGPESSIRLNVEFNTVAWSHLAQPVRQLLQGTKAASDSRRDKFAYSPTVQRDLKELLLKFSNGVKIYGLLPGEQLEELVFQPSLSKRRFFLFRQNVTANTLLLLSTHYMVVIQEDLDVRQGWIVSYIPRNCIVGMRNYSCAAWNDLTVRLKRGGQTAEHKISLRRAAVDAWRTRWIQRGGQWEDIPAQTQMR